MNKKLMALAVAGAVTAPGLALAQVGGSSGVTLYGRLDETIVNSKYSANGVGNTSSVTKSDVWSPGNAMGVRGREDLGGGTSVWFQLETGVWPDGRLDSAATSGQHFGGRNSGLGVSSGIGDIMFGIWDQPYKVAYGTWNSVTSGGFSAAGIIMGNGDTTGALNNPNCATALNNATGSITVGANGVCATEVTSNGTAWSRRTNNSIQYWSPVFSGVQFRVGTALANYQSPDTAFVNGTPKPQVLSGNVTWARGPLSLAGAYETHKGLRAGIAAGQNPNPKDTAIQIGGKWNFGLAEVGAGYEQLKYDDNGTATGAMKVPSWVVNGRVNAGPGAVWGSYSKSQGGKSCNVNQTIGSAACGVQVKMMTVGYDYVLSKRTKMYVAYNKIDNGFNGTVGTNYYYIAGPAGNVGGTAAGGGPINTSGTASGISQGTDVTTVGLGLQHTF